MKKLIFTLFVALTIAFAETDPIIIIHNNSLPKNMETTEVKKTQIQQNAIVETTFKENLKNPTVNEFVQTLNNRQEPELIFTKSPTKTFSDNKMNCVLEIPVSWEMDTSSANYRLITYPYNQDSVTVKFKAYKATETITANTVYLYRSGAVWDRWQLLASKKFTPKDCFLIGVTEKISGVYKKQDLTEKLTFVNTIVAEDVYIKAPNLVYIITAEAPEETWKQYSQTIKEIMNSFYVVEDTNGKKL